MSLVSKFESEHKTKLSSKDKMSKREHFFPPSVTAKAVPPPSDEYSFAKGNVSKTKAPSDEGAVGYADWGSEKVVNISWCVFSFKV